MNPLDPNDVNLTLRDLMAEGYTGREIRYWLLSRHYRKPIFFSHGKLAAVRNTIRHLDKFVQKIYFAKSAPVNPDFDQAIYALKQSFVTAMDDDFNVAAGLAALFRFTRDINQRMDRRGLSDSDREKILAALERINSVLGIISLDPPDADPEVEALIEKRESARNRKDWSTADDLRKEMEKMGIEVIDTPDGPRWRRIGPSKSTP